MENITIEHIFNTYANYLEEPQNIDINLIPLEQTTIRILEKIIKNQYNTKKEVIYNIRLNINLFACNFLHKYLIL